MNRHNEPKPSQLSPRSSAFKKFLGECFTLEEFAASTGVEIETLDRWRREEGMPALRLRYSWLVHGPSVLKWTKRNGGRTFVNLCRKAEPSQL